MRYPARPHQKVLLRTQLTPFRWPDIAKASDSFQETISAFPATGLGRIEDGPDVLFGRDAIMGMLTVRLPFSNQDH